MATEKGIKPAGPKGYPIIGNMLDLAKKDRIKWLQRIYEAYGDVIQFKLFKTPGVFGESSGPRTGNSDASGRKLHQKKIDSEHRKARGVRVLKHPLPRPRYSMNRMSTLAAEASAPKEKRDRLLGVLFKPSN